MNVRSAVAVAAILGSVAVGGAWTATKTTTPDAHARHTVRIQMKWNATLNSMGGSSVAGTASIEPSSGGKASTVTISLTGGKAGAVYPWHVHTGKCGAAGGVWGSGAAYKPVKVGSDGTGKSTADIKMAPPSSGDYHVNVHASPTDMKTIVACGDLSMGM